MIQVLYKSKDILASFTKIIDEKRCKLKYANTGLGLGLAFSQHVVIQISSSGASDCAQFMSVLGGLAWSRDRWSD